MKFIFIGCPRCRHSFKVDTQDKDPNVVTRLKCPDDEKKPDEFGQGCGLVFDAYTFHHSRVISVMEWERIQYHEEMTNPPQTGEKDD